MCMNEQGDDIRQVIQVHVCVCAKCVCVCVCVPEVCVQVCQSSASVGQSAITHHTTHTSGNDVVEAHATVQIELE